MPSIMLHTSVEDAPLSLWHADPVVALPLCLFGVGYALALHSAARSGRRTPGAPRVIAYYLGLASLAVALLGPPDHLNGVLFVAHMSQHLLLSLVAPPLLLLGRPIETILSSLPAAGSRWLLGGTVKRPGARRLLAVLAHPAVVFVLYNATLVVWHLPGPYQAAVTSEPLHLLEHTSFLLTAFLFWWVLVGPYPRSLRLSTSAAAILLFATWMVGDLVGLTLTLAPELLYPIYGQVAKPWGMLPLADQRLGGQLMWVSGGLLFAVLLVATLVRSAASDEPDSQPTGNTSLEASPRLVSR